jgi:hypothetical protein
MESCSIDTVLHSPHSFVIMDQVRSNGIDAFVHYLPHPSSLSFSVGYHHGESVLVEVGQGTT